MKRPASPAFGSAAARGEARMVGIGSASGSTGGWSIAAEYRVRPRAGTTSLVKSPDDGFATGAAPERRGAGRVDCGAHRPGERGDDPAGPARGFRGGVPARGRFDGGRSHLHP